MLNSKTVSPEELIRRQAEEQFRFFADFIPQLVWFTDPTGFHTYFNQRWIDFTGYSLADSVGPDMWNNLLHPDDRQRARDIWGHSLATGEFYEIEYRFKSKNGDYRWFLGQAQPQFDENGKIRQWFGTCTDIHDQKLTELALRQREQELERAYSDLEVKVTFRNLELERQVLELRQKLGE
ncbi:PAS domain-containing protein [Hymenobacter lucidus]|uniref:histidine kinase n=1 Tax=Hymenobacter lucidus TaxID=2880930 RepID=A0ABS8ATJ8_9BACT|nr:PAS domain-containing protein [Hymenobacter lucidus]MCB2409069.1 PAS domain-containing protein [Hymenobacter lucidus]